jgi:membrane protein YqaA with SNARE-associated domain
VAQGVGIEFKPHHGKKKRRKEKKRKKKSRKPVLFFVGFYTVLFSALPPIPVSEILVPEISESF